LFLQFDNFQFVKVT